jgi:hypothetical protein
VRIALAAESLVETGTRRRAELAADAQERSKVRDTLGDLTGGIEDLVTNDDYMKRHFDVLGVKADRRDFAADVAASRCTPDASTSASDVRFRYS